MRKLMQYLSAAAVFAAVGVLLVLPAAAGAGRPVEHFHDTFQYTDTDFCGTGETVLGEGTITLTAWDLGNGVFKVTREFTQTLTNPANGAVVYSRSAGQTLSVAVELPSGGRTIEFVDNGLRSQLRVRGEGIVTRDAGSLHWSISFDANGDFTGVQILEVHGPHPDFVSGAYCTAAISALGL